MTTETKTLIGILALTIVIIAGGAFIAGRGQQPGISTEPVAELDRLVRDDDPIRGPVDAAVTVVEFGDFQCPACAVLHPALQQVKNDNPDVAFVFRQFPLTQVHEFAQLAAEASLAAQAQGKFWEYHDQLFTHQAALTRDDLLAHATTVGLDLAAFTAALDDHTFRQAVLQDVSDGTAVGVSATPSVYINGVLYQGLFDPTQIQAAIDAAKTGDTT